MTRACVVTMLLLGLIGCQSEDASPASPVQDAVVIEQHNKAVAAMGAFDYQQAMDVLSPLALAYPDWNDVQIDLAIAQLNRQAEGDESSALARLGDVLSRDPGNLRAAFTSGILRLHAGDIAQAEPLFSQVVQVDPSDAHAWYYLGQVRMQRGGMEDAVTAFEHAIERDPYLRSALYAGAQAARQT